MRSLFRGIAICVGMFTTIPVRRLDWDEDGLRWVMPAFPLVGLLVGLWWWLSATLLAWWAPPHLYHSVLLLVAPLLLTGLLHLDGFMDTMDAVLSGREGEERLRILKDSHLGAFGAVSMLLVLLLGLGSLSAMVQLGDIRLLVLLPLASRLLVARWMTTARPLSPNGLAATFAKAPPRYTMAWIILLAVSMAVLAVKWGNLTPVLVLPLLAAVTTGSIVSQRLEKSFGGVSGDLCGCVIVVTEVTGLLAAVLFY